MVDTIDATDLIVGRLASKVAKRALEGERIEIINAEKAVISGDKIMTFKNFKQKIDRGEPSKGPFYPKRPDRIIKRIIRGMLPYKRERGRKALKRIKVFIGNPEQIKEAKTIKSINYHKMKVHKYIRLEDLSRKLGSKI